MRIRQELAKSRIKVSFNRNRLNKEKGNEKGVVKYWRFNYWAEIIFLKHYSKLLKIFRKFTQKYSNKPRDHNQNPRKEKENKEITSGYLLETLDLMKLETLDLLETLDHNRNPCSKP
jgi:hypothetical protein